jgi:phosphoglycerate dehydrogenase-like enzyme
MTDRPRVAVLIGNGPVTECFAPGDWERLRSWAEVALCTDPGGRAPMERHAAMAGARVVMTGWGAIPLAADLLAAAPGLELWVHAAGSMAPLATPALWQRSLRLSTANQVLAEGVAEYALAVTIVGLKQVLPLARSMGQPSPAAAPLPVRELCDLSVGIVGYGAVGRCLHRLLAPFHDLKVQVCDPQIDAAALAGTGAVAASLDEVCATCDVIHNCVPWLPATEGLFGAAQFALMRDHTLFINTGRGATVDETALVAALAQRPLQAYLDVTYPEPPVAGSPLYQLPNCFLTPHIAGFAGNGRRRLGRFAVDEIGRFFAGQPLRGEVTRAVVEGMTGARPQLA